MASPFDSDEQPIPGFGPAPAPENSNNPFASVLFGMHDENEPQTFQENEHGEFQEVFPDEELMPLAADAKFDDNLAEYVSEQTKTEISSQLLEQIDEALTSRKPWIERFEEGFKMMGLVKGEADDGPFPGSSTAVMPLISEATVQFWAKSLSELVPADGPCKGTVLGKANELAVERAKRVAEYQNYECMFLDRSWYADMSRMLFALAFTGSTFKKTFRDAQLGVNTGEYVKAEDFICNYAMTDLQAATFYAHRLWRTSNQLRKSVVAGVYSDVELMAPSSEDLPEESILKLESQDFEASSTRKDSRHELYECYCELDLEEFPDLGQDGKDTEIAVPYIVTIDKASTKILSIYRDWKENDPLKRRHVIFTKYDFLPSDGFYGYGLLHMVAGLQLAATGALRLIIDGAATASLQGGFVTADASLKDQRLELEPGVWKQVNASAEDLNKAFWTPPFKEPSPVLFQVLGFLVQRVEKFAATTEMQTGTTDAKNMPVGSTVAMLEAGSKVFSTIHKGLHKALGEELRQRFELIQVYMPQGGYPYDVEGGHEGIMPEDFAPGVQVVPISDPNIFSDTQRVAQNQAVYDLAVQNPDILNKRVAIMRVLKGIKVPDIDELLVSNEPPPPMDPVSEIQAILRGQPVQAYPDQMHEAYLQHYWAFLNNPQFGGNPQIQQQIGPAAMALMGQRLAYAWAAAVRSLGVPAPMLPPPMQPEGAPPAQPGPAPGMMGPQAGMPPQQQLGPEQIAQMAAQIAPQLVQAAGLPPPPQAQGQGDGGGMSPDMQAHFEDRKTQVIEQKGQADVQAKQAQIAADSQVAQIKAAQEAQKLQQADEKHQLAIAREARLAQQDQAQQASAQAEVAAKGESLQQSKEQNAVNLAQQVDRHDAEQNMAQIKGAIEAAALARQAQQDDKQAVLDQGKTAQDISLAKVKTKQAAKPKPTPKTAKGKTS